MWIVVIRRYGKAEFTTPVHPLIWSNQELKPLDVSWVRKLRFHRGREL